MADMDKFRAETRAWLEANCPAEMRQPVTGESDVFWGGRNASFASEPQRLWFERMRDRGWTVPDWVYVTAFALSNGFYFGDPGLILTQKRVELSPGDPAPLLGGTRERDDVHAGIGRKHRDPEAHPHTRKRSR